MRLGWLLVLMFTPASAQIPALNDSITTDKRIALYEQWVAADPASISNRDLLAAAYIQKTRETTDYGYLVRASKIIDQVLSEKKDYEALRLRNLVELNLHHFSNVAEYARQMTRSAPSDPQNWGSLGDALLEMGQYDAAREAFEKMLAIRPNLFSYNRVAYYRFITGDVDGGIAMMKDAVDAGARYPENKAWCLVELGNMYFKTGHWPEAERAYSEAIETFPSLHAAYAGLGSVQAAQGKLPQAIESYKRAQSITPMVQYAGTLHDLYAATGKTAQAQQQSDLVDVVAKLEEASNMKANHTLALVYANQDRHLTRALELAQADFEVRQDVYTYDALAWALYKNKRYEDARQASEQALKLGAPEALFFYHAGMIANALGDSAGAKKQLAKALQLNAGFDFRQAAIARHALDAISAAGK
ncbi:MAG TPA: tetratricopeptide repeat protein [Bryobacteraceae bacterium]|nr:tetratricopeptide repeat protein [Bryobacteraceae bacterium]